ncbi:MAG: cadherin-like beta sandwich domain-containing protein [Nitrospira sp.]|jgi:hypothetical protein|nr:cadherin-like beta sandwich domain-containing protein [Nitrospira sp.]MDH4242278.1 cadherin-like beta sandwich domain-containing protein [Nitrospira sp.]MDH4354601.1 cadherin-like beta sandwich domain-containing protein [Nitrospira sp.]MDH5319526.1 cadherin-like beta sandwich domain-containing protein [Nitrospira sp.]
MKHALTIAHQSFAALLLMTIGLGAYGCADTAAIIEEAQLASLTVSPGDLNPAFSSSTTRYDLKVSSSDDSVTIRANPQDSATKMTINGVATNAEEARSFPLPEPPSITPITIVLTAPSGTQKTYLVFVERPVPPAPPSSNNNLSNLEVSAGRLDPAFSAGTTQYTVEVGPAVTEVTVTATKSDPNAVISGDIPNEGQATISLGGQGTSKVVKITVTAPNGDSKTYSITVKRLAPSTDSNLSALTLSAGTLIPSFSPGELTYLATVSANAETVTISATKSDPNAVISSAGSVIAKAGDPTGRVTVSLGRNATTTVSILVTAQDGITRKTYTISVFRPER